ncbi:hypothetical protein HY988_00720 [Candidatus Micrarchaeota archaeon]|nr:hypothetical protein [Candidatus Micrarchaeota archaeon]
MKKFNKKGQVPKSESVKTESKSSGGGPARGENLMDIHKPLLLFFGLLMIATIAFLALSSLQNVKISADSLAPFCESGQTRSCTYNGCGGVTTCINGVWNGCNSQQACAPGSIAPCLENGCASTYKTCNACGTGYGKCLPSN